ncbi:hypothetical protein [Reichenbachiella versicolor]|uniref:hypothetical protein n=1 Tax=Reichenbachiella versicolor TaxID=1821036 RepID=UPI000D6DE444|nr:hypothetical protein [Reichenbachiella versicolor]
MNNPELEILIRFVEKKFNNGSRKTWKNKDFEQLSFTIHRQTKILISVATLKRLFGKVKTGQNYSPQPSTLDALKQYSDFDKLYAESQEKKYRRAKLLMWSVIGAVVFCIFYLIILNPEPVFEKEENLVEGSLTLTKVEGKCPATAFFDVEMEETDKVVRVHFDDNSPSKVVNGQKHISHFYPYPGVFRPQMKSNGILVDSSQVVLVETDGWQAISHYFGKQVQARYHPMPFEKSYSDSIFHATKRDISAVGLDTSKVVVVRVDNYERTEYSGDSFHLKATVRNSTFWAGVRCYSVILLVQGTQGKVFIKLVQDGCSGYSDIVLGDVRYFGTKESTVMATDLSDWLDVEIINQEKNVEVWLGGSRVLKQSYQKSIGDIVGTSIIFHGSGSVRDFELVNPDGLKIAI